MGSNKGNVMGLGSSDSENISAEHEQILRSAIASFKISGIIISEAAAKEVLKKVVKELQKRTP